MASLTADQAQTLENIRSRLSGLSRALDDLQRHLNDPDTQAPVTAVAASLNALATEISSHDDLLSRAIVFPNAKFPANTAPAVSEHLLSTGLSLPAQDWIERGEQAAADSAATGLLSNHDRSALWNAAQEIARLEARKEKWGADYTLAEVQRGVEHIKTGLKRELIVPEEDDDDEFDEDEEDEDEDEPEAPMDVDSPTVPASQIATGAVTSSRLPPGDVIDYVYYLNTGKRIDPVTKKRILPVK